MIDKIDKKDLKCMKILGFISFGALILLNSLLSYVCNAQLNYYEIATDIVTLLSITTGFIVSGSFVVLSMPIGNKLYKKVVNDMPLLHAIGSYVKLQIVVSLIAIGLELLLKLIYYWEIIILNNIISALASAVVSVALLSFYYCATITFKLLLNNREQ